jgi:hypothetical protein
MKASSMPIFLEEQGMCTATLSRTLLNSSLSSRKWRTNSTGSYRENLRGGKQYGRQCGRQYRVSCLWA